MRELLSKSNKNSPNKKIQKIKKDPVEKKKKLGVTSKIVTNFHKKNPSAT